MRKAINPYKQAQKRRKIKRVVAIIAILLGVVLLVFGAFPLLRDLVISNQLQSLGDEVKVEELTGTGEAVDEDSVSELDWNALHDINSDVVAWLQVDNTNIDYPVAQGSDNEYYLYHDIYGNYSYCGVFADYRCNVDGENAVVYGHHMANGTMFASVARVQHQDYFNNIGDLHWSTEAGGTTTLHPLFAMSEYKNYGNVQQFDFTPSTEDVNVRALELAKASGLEVTSTDEVPQTLKDAAYKQVHDEGFDKWLQEFAQDASASSDEGMARIASGDVDRVVCLITCSSGTAGMPYRTIMVFG